MEGAPANYGTSNGNYGDEGEWTIYSSRKNKWRKKQASNVADESSSGRRKAQHDSRRELPSLFIGNIQRGTTKKDLWECFTKVGEVADVFIRIQHSKPEESGRGRGYAFVRFFYHRAMMEALDKKKEFLLKCEKLIIRRALPAKKSTREEQNTPKEEHGKQRSYAQATKQRSYAQVTKEGISGNQASPNFNREEKLEKKIWNKNITNDHQEWTKKSMIGEMREFNTCKSICSELQSVGMECSVRYLGGIMILITFHGVKSMKQCQHAHRKFNVDAAVAITSGQAGIGGLLRDEHGKTKTMFSKAVFAQSVEMAEFMTIMEALRIYDLLSYGNRKDRLIIESDSSIAVNWFKDPNLIPWGLQSQKQILQFVKLKQPSMEAAKIGRNCNLIADNLAKAGINRNDPLLAYL